MAVLRLSAYTSRLGYESDIGYTTLQNVLRLHRLRRFQQREVLKCFSFFLQIVCRTQEIKEREGRRRPEGEGEDEQSERERESELSRGAESGDSGSRMRSQTRGRQRQREG